jgi:meso-butanediol dehydrogenase / (S,S)-butanediol dehydrogenase / diacetyl reductase
VTCDVTRGQDVTAMVRAVTAAHGRLDIVVSNAGLTLRADFRHLTDAEWVAIREVNLDGVLRIARDTFPLLAKSKHASLINIASILGQRGLRPAVAYSTTKGAVAAMTRGLAVEYAPFGIRVNTVSPGFVRTALTERVMRNPMLLKTLVDETVLKRLGDAHEIAKAVLFFASDDSSYCTGSELVVDGGMSASL